MPSLRTIGILGGSFNPAHEGHLQLSHEAIKALGLQEVWWLVSPQNPLKPKEGMGSFSERFTSAQRIAKKHGRIHVCDFENRMDTRYTADTLRKLIKTHRNIRFVWLMGADNLVQIDQWQEWHTLFEHVHIAVYDRKPHTFKALSGKAARTYAKQRVDPKLLLHSSLPAWCFIHGKRHALSATFIRNLLGSNTFLRHNKDAVKDK
jgi:nicotinate-nucleotide adenylyltransferase